MKYDMICERKVEYKCVLTAPAVVYGFLVQFLKLNKKAKENFVVITLDSAHVPISVRTVSVGTVNRALVHPREIFRPAIVDNAAAIIIAHNHPSGKIEPSPEDFDITRRLKQASEILGISILDHLIVGKTDFYSMSKKGTF